MSDHQGYPEDAAMLAMLNAGNNTPPTAQAPEAPPTTTPDVAPAVAPVAPATAVDSAVRVLSDIFDRLDRVNDV